MLVVGASATGFRHQQEFVVGIGFTSHLQGFEGDRHFALFLLFFQSHIAAMVDATLRYP